MTTAPAAGFSQTLNDIFERYFDVWQRHDVAALDTVFETGATYEIDPLRQLHGIQSIKKYWISNQKRQRQVRYGFTVIAEDPVAMSGTAAFSSEFFDVQHGKRLTLGGTITIELSGGRISALRERYSTFYSAGLMERAKYLIPLAAKGRLSKALHWASSVTRGLYDKLIKSAYKVVLAFYVILIVLTAETNFLEGKNFLGFKFDFFSASAEPRMANLINGCFAAGLILQVIATGVKQSQTFKTFPVLNRGVEDLQIMERQMRDASRVTIVSGDFSFLSQNLSLRRTLEQLAERKRLRLVSTKANGDVTAAAQSSAGHLRIINRLIAGNAISFDCSADVKCSIVERTGVSAALFMYYSVETGSHRIAVLQESGETVYVYKMLKELVESLH